MVAVGRRAEDIEQFVDQLEATRSFRHAGLAERDRRTRRGCSRWRSRGVTCRGPVTPVAPAVRLARRRRSGATAGAEADRPPERRGRRRTGAGARARTEGLTIVLRRVLTEHRRFVGVLLAALRGQRGRLRGRDLPARRARGRRGQPRRDGRPRACGTRGASSTPPSASPGAARRPRRNSRPSIGTCCRPTWTRRTG